MRGSLIFSPESSSAAIASPNRICDAAIDSMIATADPNVSHVAARVKNDSRESMNGTFSMAERGPDNSSCIPLKSNIDYLCEQRTTRRNPARHPGNADPENAGPSPRNARV
ncbi:hypothetical protein SBA3_3390024 [Candidatus Sulfopaludibacter sp. SbA3]|nr:hypothetical protein SBA3_3390024 [Candidatus Sulfopaludibacter sp. SbA3]